MLQGKPSSRWKITLVSCSLVGILGFFKRGGRWDDNGVENVAAFISLIAFGVNDVFCWHLHASALTPSSKELLFPLVSLFEAVCLTLVSSKHRKPVTVVPWQHSKPNSLGWPHTELPLPEFMKCLWLCAPLGGSRGFSEGLTWALFKGAVKNLSYFPYHTFFIINHTWRMKV